MSFQAIAWAVRQTLPCPQKIVLVMLADRHNADTGRCDPSHDRLALDCGLTRRSVIDQIGKLAAAGLLMVVHRAQDGLKRSNAYRLNLRAGKQVDDVQEMHIDVNDVPRVVNDVHRGSEPRSHKSGIEPVKNLNTGAGAPVIVAKVEKPESVEPETWADFLALRNQKKSKLSATALKVIEREAVKAGWTLEAAITECCGRGWQSFKAEWVAEKAVATASRFPDKNAVPPVSAVWHESKGGIEAKAADLGIAPQGSVESFPAFTARVLRAAAPAAAPSLGQLSAMAAQRRGASA